MKLFLRQTVSFFRGGHRYLSLVFGLLLAYPAFAQANSPWENAVNVLQQAFTSTIARGLSLVAIVVSGLTFAFVPLKPTSVTHSMW
jgi:type IV secretory pathway VirB2 component (pilin)